MKIINLSNEYIAGLFDGEGWFQIDKSQRKDCKFPSFQVHARICMRDHFILKSIQAKFGGSLRKSAAKTDKHAEYWSWDIGDTGIIRLYNELLPYIKIKKQQLILAYRFQLFKSKNSKFRPNTPERVDKLTKMYTKMRFLNKKGVNHR